MSYLFTTLSYSYHHQWIYKGKAGKNLDVMIHFSGVLGSGPRPVS